MSSSESPSSTTAVADALSVGDVVATIEETTLENVEEKAEESVEEVVEVVKEKVEELVSNAVEEVVENEVVQELVETVAEQVVDKAFDDLVEKLNVKIGSVEITPQSVMMVVRFAMEVVEATELKGAEQKAMVLRLLEHVIRVAPISDEKEKLCLDMLSEGVVSNTIDIIVQATRGELDVNTVVENAVEIAASTGCCGLLSLMKTKKSA
jgi:hypothetical protein